MMNIFARKPKEPPPTIKHLAQEGSGNCCGADFLAWFPQPVMDWDEDDRPIPNDISEEVLKNVRLELKAHIEKTANSMMLILLNNHQKKFYDEMIKEAGFRTLMTDVYHPAHGNNLTLYGWKKYTGKDDPRIEEYY